MTTTELTEKSEKILAKMWIRGNIDDDYLVALEKVEKEKRDFKRIFLSVKTALKKQGWNLRYLTFSVVKEIVNEILEEDYCY